MGSGEGFSPRGLPTTRWPSTAPAHLIVRTPSPTQSSHVAGLAAVYSLGTRLNGVVIVDVDLETVGPHRIHGHNLAGLHNKRGHIGLCGHGHRIEFRSLRIQEL